jgi:hypothetical protein
MGANVIALSVACRRSNETQAQPPLAAASFARINNCFISESELTRRASSWLQRWVR